MYLVDTHKFSPHMAYENENPIWKEILALLIIHMAWFDSGGNRAILFYVHPPTYT